MTRDSDRHTAWDEWEDEQDYLTDRLMDSERDYYSRTAEILSRGTKEQVRDAIRRAGDEGRNPYDFQDAMIGADYPIDAGGFTGTKEQCEMVLEEMRAYGEETGDPDWENAAYLADLDLKSNGWDALGPKTGSFGIRGVMGGLGSVVANGVGRIRESVSEHSPSGDIRVSAHTRVVNGKPVRVRGHRRKR